MALALGDGGGSTTPEDEWLASVLPFAGVSSTLDWRGEDSAEAEPSSSDFSLGIWTFNCGLFAPIGTLFVRDGGGNSCA